MKIGIFGGSFNPVHCGHIYLAESVRDSLGLDRVIFVPSKISPHKSNSEYVSEYHRLKMLELAVEGEKGFEISEYELRCERISYSIYTAEHFRKKFPDDELYLLIGSDMFLSFEKWYRFEDIMKLVTLVVVSRESQDYQPVEEKYREFSRLGKIIICPVPAFPASSTEIRKKIRENENYACYLDKNVVQYITSNNLYK